MRGGWLDDDDPSFSRSGMSRWSCVTLGRSLIASSSFGPFGRRAPSLALDESRYPLLHLVADLTDPLDRLALRILERPVVASDSRHDGAGLTAAHRDQHGRGGSQVFRQESR